MLRSILGHSRRRLASVCCYNLERELWIWSGRAGSAHAPGESSSPPLQKGTSSSAGSWNAAELARERAPKGTESYAPLVLNPSFARSPQPVVCVDTHQTVIDEKLPELVPLNFDDGIAAFKAKTTWEIFRSLIVFRICRISWLVEKADTVLKLSKKLFTPALVNFVIDHTFYRQFVAGGTPEDVRRTLRYLSSNGIHAVMDYAAENDMDEETGVQQSRAVGGISSAEDLRTSTVVARTYRYEDEEACDERMEHFMESINGASRDDDQQGFAAIKLTGLGNPLLLERVSRALLSVRDLFQVMDENQDGMVDREEFIRVCSKLFTSSDEKILEEFARMDVDGEGRVDYLSFTKGISIYRGVEIASNCRNQGPFARAALSEEELALLGNMMKRVNMLAEAAVEKGVRIMVDAEHSYFQPAIDSVATELQQRYGVDGVDGVDGGMLRIRRTATRHDSPRLTPHPPHPTPNHQVQQGGAESLQHVPNVPA